MPSSIEGKALAVAWELEQTRYFTQGCDNLVVITDHKPLVKNFGDQMLDNITNSPLLQLEQCTFPGTSTSNTYPAKPTTSSMQCPGTLHHLAQKKYYLPWSVQHPCTDGIHLLETQELDTISWSLLARKMTSDTSLSPFLKFIKQGAPALPTTTLLLHPCGPSGSLCIHRRVSFCFRTLSLYPHHSAPTYCRTSMQLTNENR